MHKVKRSVRTNSSNKQSDLQRKTQQRRAEQITRLNTLLLVISANAELSSDSLEQNLVLFLQKVHSVLIYLPHTAYLLTVAPLAAPSSVTFD